MITLAVAMPAICLNAQDKKPDFQVPEEVAFRTENIISEGTRMAAEVFAPKASKTDKLPTIIMSHGWGGTAPCARMALSSRKQVTWWWPLITAAGATVIRG